MRAMREGRPEGTTTIEEDGRTFYQFDMVFFEQVEDENGKNMESFKFGEPTWQPANTHGGETANVIEECHIVEVELK